MSAFEVLDVHIDAMVSALRQFKAPGMPVVWYDEPMPQFESSYRRGEPWGDISSYQEWAKHHKREFYSFSRADLTNVGRILRAANRDSVNFRYNELEIEDAYEHTYIHDIDPIRLLGALDCYEYQSCESPTWPASEAKQIVKAIRDLTLDYIKRHHPRGTVWAIAKPADVQHEWARN